MSVDRGTIVYADDPFNPDGTGRPWVVINTPAMPYSDTQHVVLTLTSKTWHDDRIPIDDDDLAAGSLPETSSILPWAVAAIEADDIDETLGRVYESVVDEATKQFVSYLGLDPGVR